MPTTIFPCVNYRAESSLIELIVDGTSFMSYGGNAWSNPEHIVDETDETYATASQTITPVADDGGAFLYTFPDSTAILGIDTTGFTTVEIGVKGYKDERFNHAYILATEDTTSTTTFETESGWYEIPWDGTGWVTINIWTSTAIPFKNRYRIPLDTTEGTYWFDITHQVDAPAVWLPQDIVNYTIGLFVEPVNPFGSLNTYYTPRKCFLDQVYWRLTYDG